ncbi:hypothetical protein C0J52_03367 [Blattella germanica]|nr:hypothetical protein C0J52_03367 [Blattella germanica]
MLYNVSFHQYEDELNKECPQLSKDEVDTLKTEAQKLLEHETTIYNNKNLKSSAKSEYGWIHTIMNKGTVSDRIAAHTIAIQDAPLYTLPLLKNLVNMAKILLRNIINKLGDPSQKVASKAIYSLIQLLQVHPNMKFVVMEETEKLLFRAYPFAKPDMDKMMDHIDTMYRVVHHANFNISLHTLSLLFQVADFANSVSDRFYSALYKKMLDPELATSSQQALFLSLVFKALKKDNDINRTKIFFKRLLQICAYLPIPLICGILYMVSQLSKEKAAAIALKMQAVSDVIDDEDGEEHYEDIKIEDSEDLLTDVLQKKTLTKSETNEVESDPPKNYIPTWYHCKNQMSGTMTKKNKKPIYDPLQRNPLFAGGEHCVYTELLKLSQHFHPTVTLFANNILQGEIIKYPGDPLLDFALPRFLDRFVFKNPKKDINSDIIKQNKFSRKKSYFPRGIRSLCVNSASYLNEDDSRIPVDELFMYRYLKKKRGDHEGKVKDKDEDDYDSDASSVGSDDFNEILDRMMGGSKNNDLDFAEDVAKSKSNKNKAEEFSEMLDNMGTSGQKASGSAALSTKDRAGAKQLKWETARDFWMKKGEKKPGKKLNNKRKWNNRPGGKKDDRNAKRRKKR